MAKRKTKVQQRREALVQKRKASKKQRDCDSSYDDSDDVIESMLSDKLEAIGIGFYMHMDECDSTNNIAKYEATKFVTAEVKCKLRGSQTTMSFEDRLGEMLLIPGLPLVLTTDRQTAGRGRKNNSWWSGDGALMMSMLFEAKQHHLTPQTSAHLSLGVGYSVMQAIRTTSKEIFAKRSECLANTSTQEATEQAAMPLVEIRWPNDVYVNDKKIAGILIEAPTPKHIVVGIGVNTNCTSLDAPEEIRDRVVTLRDTLQSEIDQPGFIFELCREILDMLNYFPARLPELIDMIEKELCQVGKEVCINREGEIIEGTCLGLNPDGSLRVQTSNGERSVVSGVLQ